MKGTQSMRQALEPTQSPAWVIRQDGLDPLRDSSRESRFAVSNGFLGVRGGRAVNAGAQPLVPPCTFVAGLFDSLGAEQPIPALVPIADWLQVRITLPEGPLIRDPDEVSSHTRTLDMRRGALLVGGDLTGVPGLAFSLRTLRLVSLADCGLGLQLIRLEAGTGEVEVTLEASFGRLDFGLEADLLVQDLAVWRTHSSGKRLAMAAASSLELDGQVLPPERTAPFVSGWRWRTRPGQVACFHRIVAVARGDTPDADVGGTAQRRLGSATRLGWRGVLAAHEAAWVRRWRCSDVVVEGDPAAQQALRFAAYHLNGAANPDDPRVSVAARGLTGSDYRGHVFWDTEIFLLPFYTLTWPEAARALLMYRHRTLDAARAKAAAAGWRGAMYAWESADTGAETTPEQAVGPDRKVVQILCGTQEQHITADVAYAVWQYWQATGDEAFLTGAGAEILLETGRFWVSRAGLEADGRRHIRGVIGPDEYHETIDDNAFTNVMARWNIRRAAETAGLMRARWPDIWQRLSHRIGLEDAEVAQWPAAADRIETGLDPETGLFEQFAGYFGLEHVDLLAYAGRSVPMAVVLGRERTARSQVIKQADVVALLMLLPEEFPGSTATDNFNYYEPSWSHGSSLSRAMHGVAAARLGYADAALRFFEGAASMDLADTHAAIDGGIHMAALGGVWLTAVFGFAGVALRDDGLALNPQLPERWRSLAFSVQWRGRSVRIAITQAGLAVTAVLEGGEPMTLCIHGKSHELSRDKPLEVVALGSFRACQASPLARI
jgi:trehalose/maltose hydrolase-like predicted phosphorylase